MTKKKFITMQIAANTPNVAMGMMGDSAVAKNAVAVVKLVLNTVAIVCYNRLQYTTKEG